MISWYELQGMIGLIGIYAILAMSLNMITGMTGLLQLGQAGFFAVGAYAAGLTAIYMTFPNVEFFNLFIGIVAAIIAAGIFSFIIGLPCLRLRGDYLAIATLGFGMIVRLTLTNLTFPGGKMFPDSRIGGATGIAFTDFPGEVWSGFENYSAEYACWGVVWIFVIVTWMIMINLKKSSFGRAMMCIREDEIAAQAMGVNLAKYKMLAFLISAAFAGVAGALFFHMQLRVDPGNFRFMTSIEILLMVVLGGLGSVTGSVLGAVILGMSPFILRHLGIGEYQQLIYALLLIVLIRLVPNGLLGMREIPGFFSKRADSKTGKN